MWFCSRRHVRRNEINTEKPLFAMRDWLFASRSSLFARGAGGSDCSGRFADECHRTNIGAQLATVKRLEPASRNRFVSGHGFSRAERSVINARASAPAKWEQGLKPKFSWWLIGTTGSRALTQTATIYRSLALHVDYAGHHENPHSSKDGLSGAPASPVPAKSEKRTAKREPRPPYGLSCNWQLFP